MTVNESVQLLATYSPDLRVVVNGYEEGYDDLSPGQVSLVKIALNTDKERWDRETRGRVRLALLERLTTLKWSRRWSSGESRV